jgi:hypothetical protein
VNHGSIVLVRPDRSDREAFAGWCSEYLDPEAQFFGNALVVEPRYAANIVEALVGAGFEVEG